LSIGGVSSAGSKIVGSYPPIVEIEFAARLIYAVNIIPSMSLIASNFLWPARTRLALLNNKLLNDLPKNTEITLYLGASD
jgi:hypothetical protein